MLLGIVPEDLEVAPVVVVILLLLLFLRALAADEVVGCDVRRNEEHLDKEEASEGHRAQVKDTLCDLLREEFAYFVEVDYLVAEVLASTLAPLEELIDVTLDW